MRAGTEKQTYTINASADIDSIENVFRIHGTIGVKLGKGNVRES